MTKPALKRSLSLPILVLYGLGNILGAGIYVLVGKVAGAAGLSAPLAFVMAMVVAGLTAFSYMELSSRFPKSAGSSLYTYKAFGWRWLSLVVGLAMVLAGVASAATLAQGFAGYMGSMVAIPPLLASAAMIVLLTAVTLIGVGESAKTAALFTLVEVAGLLLIIGFGVTGSSNLTLDGAISIDPAVGLSGVLLGAFLAFYAFIGFEDMVNVAEEVKRPERTMPIAILVSLISGTVLYLLVVLVSIAAVSPAELAANEAPLSLVLERVSSIDPAVISFIGMAAAFNGIIVQLIMGSRMLYGLSSQGWIHRIFATVHPSRHTPTVATLVVAGLALIATIFLPLVSLAKATSFLVLLIFCLVNVSLVVVKRRTPKPAKGGMRVPITIPITGALCTLAVVLYQIKDFIS